MAQVDRAGAEHRFTEIALKRFGGEKTDIPMQVTREMTLQLDELFRGRSFIGEGTVNRTFANVVDTVTGARPVVESAKPVEIRQDSAEPVRLEAAISRIAARLISKAEVIKGGIDFPKIREEATALASAFFGGGETIPKNELDRYVASL